MAHAFTTIPAKPTFVTLTKVEYQSDYISNKKANLLYCNNRDKTNCNKLTKQSLGEPWSKYPIMPILFI